MESDPEMSTENKKFKNKLNTHEAKVLIQDKFTSV